MFEYNVNNVRKDFPILQKKVIYFDNACMSLKPIQVINKMNEYYFDYTACVARSLHKFAVKTTEEMDNARHELAKFVNAKSDSEIIITRNTTEGINLVANCLDLKKGDEVIISDKEHNSNLIPWLKLKKEKGIKLVISKTNKDGTFNLENFEDCFSKNTKLVSVVMTSNIDGVTNPVKEISEITHEHDALLMIDGAQGIPRIEIDVRKLNIDFLAFSGHKMIGPSGTGILYGKKELLENMPQFMVGGETVLDSTYDSYKPEHLPHKFEAGLQNYAGMIGLAEAARYLKKVGLKDIEKREIMLNKMVSDELADKKEIQLLGPREAELRGGIFSFNIKGMDPHHISRILDSSKNIAIRSGNHCVHSWFNAHKINGSARASFYLYNTEEEAQVFIDEMKKIIKLHAH